MAKTEEKAEPKVEIPDTAPFGATMIWGKKGVGKTLACLNSPWKPVLVFDTENSSKEYSIHQGKLIELGILNGEFQRFESLDYKTLFDEFVRISKSNEQYGTIVVDTGGQWSEWVAKNRFDTENKSEKLGQIVWGKIRDDLRRTILMLTKHCKCLLFTAHERKYGSVIDPRANPALLEITAISIRLTRDPNMRLPAAQFVASRVPFFPPQVRDFTITKMLSYFGSPADWNKLEEDNKIPPEPVFEGEPTED